MAKSQHITVNSSWKVCSIPVTDSRTLSEIAKDPQFTFPTLPSAKHSPQKTSSLSTNKGFTFIELLITLAILAILFVPVMQLFSHSLYSTAYSQELITATNLARWEMERVKNLNLTKVQLAERGDSLYPAAEKPPLAVNNLNWRIKREIIKNTDPLEVHVSVYRDEEPDKILITLVTLIEDKTWVEYHPVK